MRIVLLNVNGVIDPVNRANILSKLKMTRADVVFLQETHLNNSEHKNDSKRASKKCILAHTKLIF